MDLHDFWLVERPSIMKRAAKEHPSAFLRSLALLARPTSRDLEDEDNAFAGMSIDESMAAMLAEPRELFPDLKLTLVGRLRCLARSGTSDQLTGYFANSY
jgi:hypothetical protein